MNPTKNEAEQAVIEAAGTLTTLIERDLILGGAQRDVSQAELDRITEGLAVLLFSVLGDRAMDYAITGVAVRKAVGQLRDALDSLHETRS